MGSSVVVVSDTVVGGVAVVVVVVVVVVVGVVVVGVVVVVRLTFQSYNFSVVAVFAVTYSKTAVNGQLLLL